MTRNIGKNLRENHSKAELDAFINCVGRSIARRHVHECGRNKTTIKTKRSSLERSPDGIPSYAIPDSPERVITQSSSST